MRCPSIFMPVGHCVRAGFPEEAIGCPGRGLRPVSGKGSRVFRKRVEGFFRKGSRVFQEHAGRMSRPARIGTMKIPEKRVRRDVDSFLMLRLFLPDSCREIGPQSYSHKELRSATKTCTWKRPQTSDVIFVTTDTLKFSLVSSEKRIKPRLPWTSNLLLIYDLLL